MTAIFYPDRKSVSSSGRFTLEARSPHNGGIPHRDGRPVSDDEFGFKYRQHQNEFRYRLFDDAGRTIWERFQMRGEDSPHEVVVSDEGWSVIRTHGFRPEVITVDHSGRDAVRVQIVGDGSDHELIEPTVPSFDWSTNSMSFSTAGLYWTTHSWRYFTLHEHRPYFAWRSATGERLVLDLVGARLIPDGEQAATGLGQALVAEEMGGVTTLFRELSSCMTEVRSLLAPRPRTEEDKEGETEPHPLTEKISRVTAALDLAGIYRMTDCVPYLREWEPIDCPSYSTSSTAMGGKWWLQTQHFRPILHHSLRLMNQELLGYPTYHFVDFVNDDKTRFPLPEWVPNRHQRAKRLNLNLSAPKVLALLGSPDHVARDSRKAGSRYVWSEYWEYDFLDGNNWNTLRLTWEEGKPGGRMSDLKEGPSDWVRGDDRKRDILGH